MKQVYLKLKNGKNKISHVAVKYEEIQQAGQAHLAKYAVLMDNHNAIRMILNTYEAIAVAIDTGTLDEEMVKRSHKSNIIDTVKTCEGFINETRERAKSKNPKDIYKECQTLTKRWKG